MAGDVSYTKQPNKKSRPPYPQPARDSVLRNNIPVAFPRGVGVGRKRLFNISPFIEFAEDLFDGAIVAFNGQQRIGPQPAQEPYHLFSLYTVCLHDRFFTAWHRCRRKGVFHSVKKEG